MKIAPINNYFGNFQYIYLHVAHTQGAKITLNAALDVT